MTTLDTISLAVFTLLVLLAGLSFARSGTSMKSFFAAGGAVPWWISGLSLFMSFFSVGTFVVWGSIAYNSGFVAVTIQFMICIAGFVVGLLIAPKWNKTGVITAAEFIAKRLGKRTQKFYTYVFLFISLFTAGAFLYPVGKIVEVSTGIPLEACIICLGAIIIAYTAIGGLWAVLVTDVLQFVVLTAAVVILVPLAFDNVGGIDGFVSGVPESFFELSNEEYSWGFMFAFGLYNAIFIGGNWAYVQRYTSVKDPSAARKTGLLFGVLYIVSPLIWMLPPMIYRVMQPELSGLENEGAYLLVAKEVLPKGLLGLVLGGMVFATASSVNTTLNISSGVFTNDIYRYFRPEAKVQKQMWVARLATVAFGIFSVIVALLVQHMGGIVEVVLSVAALTGGALYLPPIWAMYSRYQTGASILSATIISLLVNAFFKFLSPVWLDIELSRSAEMLLGVFGPVAVLSLFELYYRLQGNVSEGYQNFQPGKSISEATEEDDSANTRGATVIAKGVLATGILIVVLGFLSDSDALLVTSVGVVISVIAAALLLKRRKEHQPVV